MGCEEFPKTLFDNWKTFVPTPPEPCCKCGCPFGWTADECGEYSPCSCHFDFEVLDAMAADFRRD